MEETKPVFLLDSNICIYILADAQCAAALRLSECTTGSVAVSAISYAEIAKGSKLPITEFMPSLDALFETLDILSFDRAAALAYFNIPFRRASFDRLIAAHALALDLTLVTNNTRDFADIPGLRVENWA